MPVKKSDRRNSYHSASSGGEYRRHGSSRGLEVYDPYGPGDRRKADYRQDRKEPRRRVDSADHRRHRRVPRFGTVVFLLILLYIIINLISYSTSDPIAGYEVRTGSLSSDQIYTGIALREEEIVDSEYDGYVNYFDKDADRIGVGQLAYTVDESGQVQEYLTSEMAGGTLLEDSDYQKLQSDIVDYLSDYSPTDFASVYDFRDSLRSTVQKMSSSYVLDDISQLSDSGLSSSIHQCTAKDTGIITFNTDSMAGKTFDDLTADDFTADAENALTKTEFENNQLVVTGDPVYRLCTNENWSVAIKTTQDTAQSLSDAQYVQVRFLKNRDTIWAYVSATKSMEDGSALVNLSFSNSMIDFCDDRYIKLELLTEQETGLKVPNSSIIQSDFFLVPKDYITTGPSGNQGVLLETYDQDGAKSVTFTEAAPYSETDDSYYLDESVLKAGDVIDKPDSTDTYTISDQGELTGVYNINRGYAEFREISILYQNDEYSIVEPNTLYGLREYDHIVLDASSVTPDTIIY